MAVSVRDGLGENPIWFALSYAIARVILAIEYLRTRRHVPDAPELITRYSIGFSIVAGIWFVFVFVPLPFRLILWVVAMGIDIGIHLLFPRRLSVQFAPNVHHLPERLRFLAIIVSGISILGVLMELQLTIGLYLL